MRALILRDGLHYRTDYPEPEAREGETLVQVRLAGICRTDIELVRGYMGFRGIPGHEFVGEVVQSRAGSLVGERVVGEINCGCGVCAFCRRGLGRHCPNRTVLGIVGRDGAFADYLVLPAENLHPVPSTLRDEEAIFTEPLAAALEIVEQVHISPDWRIAVLGDGKLGLLVAQVLRRLGAETTIWGRHPEKMKLLDGLGIRLVVAEPVPEDSKRGFDLVVEATGSWAGLDLARALLRPRGTLVLKSTLAAGQDLNLSWLVVDEISMIGSRCGPFRPALSLLAANEIRTEALIEKTYPLEQWEAAFRQAMASGSKKVLLDMRYDS